MIVQCDKCGTKFRVADDKITQKGVKVRCSRCKNSFVVQRTETDAPTIPPTFAIPSAPPAVSTQQSTAPVAPSFVGAMDPSPPMQSVPSARPAISPRGNANISADLDLGLTTSDDIARAVARASSVSAPLLGGAAGLPFAPPMAQEDDDPFAGVSLDPIESGAPHGHIAVPFSTATEGDSFPDPSQLFGANPFGLPSGGSDIPGLLPEGASDDDPFAGLDLDPAQPTPASAAPEDLFATDFRADDPPSSQGGMSATLFEESRGAEHFAREEVSLPQFAASADIAVGPRATRPTPAFDPDEFAPKAARRIARWPTYLGVAIGIGVASVALPGVGDHLGTRKLLDLVRGGDASPLADHISEITPTRTKLRTYATTHGGKLFVVTGAARNTGSERLSGLRAVALVMNGDAIAEERRAWLGIELGEEVLANLTDRASIDAAYDQAATAWPSPADASRLDPGNEIPFMIVFPELPAEIEERTFRIEFVKEEVAPMKAPPNPTAAN